VAVVAYTRLEIVAEKLRCILQRRQCRDFLDLHLLLDDVDVAAAADLFRRKAAHRGLDPTTFGAKFEKRVEDYSAGWETELAEYLGEVPHFEAVERHVRRVLRRAKLV
jgi:predicted nucleotidyltransferase component of viral defense system